jgi:hypothetical protein
MKSIVCGILMVSLAACGQNSNQSSAVQSTSNGVVTRPAQAVVLNGKDADAFIAIVKAAGVPSLQAIESTSWSMEKIECGQFFIASAGLQSNCELGLPSDPAGSHGPVTRPNMSIVLNGKSAKSLISFLKDIVGVKPLSAIESTTWTTGAVECSRSFLAGHGLISECSITLK